MDDQGELGLVQGRRIPADRSCCRNNFLHGLSCGSDSGSGGREEKIRTYNFPQNRLTDHRIGYTSHNLDGILMGQLEDLIMALQHAEMQERLAEAGMS